MFLGSPPPPQICAIELRRYSCSTLARGKRKHIMRFEIRYFFLEVGLSLPISSIHLNSCAVISNSCMSYVLTFLFWIGYSILFINFPIWLQCQDLEFAATYLVLLITRQCFKLCSNLFNLNWLFYIVYQFPNLINMQRPSS